MKVLGSIFLLLGLVAAFAGWVQTGSESSMALHERIAEADVEALRDLLRTYQALKTGERSDVAKIRDPKQRKIAIDGLNGTEPVEPRVMATYLRDAEHKITIAETKYDRMKADRESRMTWFYIPAGCLIVIGLILLVVPSPQAKPMPSQR